MKQHEAVERAMRERGGYATLGHLYQSVLKIPGCEWETKTPFASIRRIVQENPKFFKIKPGLWALTAEREAVLKKFSLTENASPKKIEEFGHSYYQGLIVEIGNLNYRTIALNNWELFEPVLAYGKSGNKEKRTSWMAFLNEKRKTVAHASSAVTLSFEDLNQLQEYDKWFLQQITGAQDSEKGEADAQQ